MLTYPSDPLPQIVCPMDEDAIPPNRFCSAPPQSEPPSPPLPPFSSITPSLANDGISGHRRSGRIQWIRSQTPKKQSNTYSGAAQKPSRQNPSPSKRQTEGGRMVQVSQTKQPRDESTHVHEKQNQDGVDCSFTAKHQNKKKDQKSPEKKTIVSVTENEAEQFDDLIHELDTTKSDMDTYDGLTVRHTLENPSAKGWVIGPLFQSFKSKMASFTEIVMSPVKLFTANSPPPSMDHPDQLDECELLVDATSDVDHTERCDMFNPESQSEKRNQDTIAEPERPSKVECAQNIQTVDLKCSKKLSFDEDFSTQSSQEGDDCAITGTDKNISVPLQHSPLPCIASGEVSESNGSISRSSLLLQPYVNVSPSFKSKVNISSANEEQKGKRGARLKPLPRKCTRTRRKATTKILVSEVAKKESDPEVIDEHVSFIKSNEAMKDSCFIDKTLSLPSSDCKAQPLTDCPQPNDDEDKKIESCHLGRQSLQNNLEDDDNLTQKPTVDLQQLNMFMQNPQICSAVDHGRGKRELELDCHSQDYVKRKRRTADMCIRDSKNQELLNMAPDGVLRRPRPARKNVTLKDPVVAGEEMMKAAKTKTVSIRNRKGKRGQEMLTTINEAVLNTQTESSTDAVLVCSLDKASGVSEDKVKPAGSSKRPKARKGLGKPDVNIDNGMDLETTIAITSTKQIESEPLSDVLVRSDIKQLPATRKCRDISKKPQKRKSPSQANSKTESDGAVVSTSLSIEQLEVTTTEFNTSPHVQEEESRKPGLNQQSKRPRKGFRNAVKSSVAGGSQEIKQGNLHLITKENLCQEGKPKISMDPLYFEMTPFENSNQPPSPSQPNLDCSIHLNSAKDQESKGKEENVAASMEDEVFPSDASNHSGITVSSSRSSARRVKSKPRRDNQRRKCKVLHSRIHKGEEVLNSVTMDDTDLATASTSENSPSKGLLRSYSCPEIPSVRSHDMPWTPLHAAHHSRIHTSPQPHMSHAPLLHHAHKSLRRARRHTVCSVEVEREIAPLCLRKEVYPSRRSFPYDGASQHLSPSHALSPSTSLSALASCFLSSPLAFLSKKVDSRGAAPSPSTSSHASSPTSSSSTYPLSPSTWRLSVFLQRTEMTNATLDSSSCGIPPECEIQRRRQSEEEDDGENTSSSSQEYEDVASREEKALSDSEIKVVQKHDEPAKVSSIRIRKTLPKPQNNLTPMGLPKAIRLKKKEFSLEEIYTNKNFSKPPESRLETIFEVPLNRRNGSESWFGQRRLKRFLEFLEVGEVRKPKKPLVGVGKAGISSSRTRRGGFPKDEPSLSVQDVDSLLCAKLDQLNLWLMHDQNNS